MKRRKVVIAAVLLMLVFPATEGFGAEWHEMVETIGAHGTVNWSTGVIAATGIGSPPEQSYGDPQARPMALKAAQLDAFRNLLEVTKGVRVDSISLVKNFMVESDVIRTQVSGMVKGAEVIKKEYLSDGTVEVTVTMNLRGGFAQLMLPKDIQQVDDIKTIPGAPSLPGGTQQAPEMPAPPGSEPTGMAAAAAYTGLVLDARGLNGRPAMSPKVVDENGQEVYGSAYVSREFAVQHGMAGYAKDLTASQTNPRVTNNPITVKALRIEGPGRSNFIISNADAAKIRGASDNLSFLKKCRVMVVLD